MQQLGEVPESQLRPLTSLEPEQQIEAWQKVVETAPEGRVMLPLIFSLGIAKSLSLLKNTDHLFPINASEKPHFRQR